MNLFGSKTGKNLYSLRFFGVKKSDSAETVTGAKNRNFLPIPKTSQINTDLH